MTSPQQTPARHRRDGVLPGVLPGLAAYRQRFGLFAAGAVGILSLTAVVPTAHAQPPQSAEASQLVATAVAPAPAPAAEKPAPAAAPAAPAPAIPPPAPTHGSPVPGARLTAHFGDGGSNWGGATHSGLDFAAPTGTPVKAVAAGTVISAGWDGPYGNRVVVKHTDGTSSTYNHLASAAVHGGRVAVGQTVGHLGSTGNSTGPHLHLEIMTTHGGFVDPLAWLHGKGVVV